MGLESRQHRPDLIPEIQIASDEELPEDALGSGSDPNRSPRESDLDSAVASEADDS